MKNINQEVWEAVDYDIEKLELIKEQSRKMSVAMPRWKVFTILYEKGFSQIEIGYFFNMDHSSVSHGLKRDEEIQEFEERRAKFIKF